MLRFSAFEDLGLSFAGMTEANDGDCSDSERRDRLASSHGFAQVSVLRQVHGSSILLASAAGTHSREGDGLITREEGWSIGVLIADCVPLLLFDPRARAAAVIHAGRMGTYANIARNAVRALEETFAIRPADLHVLIAPSAGPCCYEVSQSIADDFTGAGLAVSGRNLDLWQSNVRQLEACGVPRAQIDVSRICTICDGRFHSHRRSPDGRRNLAIVSI